MGQVRNGLIIGAKLEKRRGGIKDRKPCSRERFGEAARKFAMA
jgi:hypothetical protein